MFVFLFLKGSQEGAQSELKSVVESPRREERISPIGGGRTIFPLENDVREEKDKFKVIKRAMEDYLRPQDPLSYFQ